MDDMSRSTCSSEEVPYLFHLIEVEQWAKVKQCLNSPNGKALCRETDRSSKLTCLSLAVAFGVPTEVIQDILQTDPSLINVRDKFGATALHIACLNGASLDLITVLLRFKKSLALEIDHDNRVPLHHAVEFACQHLDANYIEVIQTLGQAAPEAIRKSDSSGDTPIDIVHYAKLSVRDTTSEDYNKFELIYAELRSISIGLYKEHKERWELESKLKKLNIEKQHIEVVPDSSASNASSSVSSQTYTTNERSMKVSAYSNQQSESQKKARRKY